MDHNNYLDLMHHMLLDEYQGLTDPDIIEQINMPVMVGLTSPFIVSMNSLAVDYGLDYAKVLQLIVELQALQAASDPATAAQLSLVLQGQIDLSNEIVRSQLDAMIANSPTGSAMAELLPQIKKLPEHWQSDSQMIMGQDITQLDIDKARLVRASMVNWDNQNQIYLKRLLEIENWDGSPETTPAIYGA